MLGDELHRSEDAMTELISRGAKVRATWIRCEAIVSYLQSCAVMRTEPNKYRIHELACGR